MNPQEKAQDLITKFRKAGCSSFPEAETNSAISSAKVCCDELIDQCEIESDQQFWRSVKYVLVGPKTKLTECESVNNGGECMCAKEGYDMTQCPHYKPLTAQPDKQREAALLDIAIKELKQERSKDKNNVNVWYNNGLSKAIIILESIQKISQPPPSPQTAEKWQTDEQAARAYADEQCGTHLENPEVRVIHNGCYTDFLRGCTHVRGQQPEDSHEKEVMMQAFSNVREIFERRSWIMEGRGSYRYDDDRYKEEVRYLYEEFDAIQKDTWKNIKSKSFEYRKKIIEEYIQSQHPADAVAFAEWATEEGYRWLPVSKVWIDERTAKYKTYTSRDLYALFTGSQPGEQREAWDKIYDRFRDFVFDGIAKNGNTDADLDNLISNLSQHYHITPKPDSHE